MKKAFTMLELVFVIVVIGILAAVIIPSTRTNPASEAAIQLLAHIRYAQHLGMMDDKYNATSATWFRNNWQIRFNGNQYSIAHNNNTAFAVNPQNTDQNLSNIDLNNKYGVTLSFSNANCQTITFDYMGRPLIGDISGDATPYPTGRPMATQCQITLTNGAESANIIVTPETGYARIL